MASQCIHVKKLCDFPNQNSNGDSVWRIGKRKTSHRDLSLLPFSILSIFSVLQLHFYGLEGIFRRLYINTHDNCM